MVASVKPAIAAMIIFGALGVCGPASATIVDVTFYGTINGFFDDTGFFGSNIRIGDAAVSTLRFDTSLGTQVVTPYSDRVSGFGSSSPSIAGSFTVEGRTIPVSGSSSGSLESDVGEQFSGSVDGAPSYIGSRFLAANSDFQSAFGTSVSTELFDGVSGTGIFPTSLFTAATYEPPAGYFNTGSFTFLVFYSGGFAETIADYNITSFTVSPEVGIPEPSSGLMLLVAVFGLFVTFTTTASSTRRLSS